MSDENETEPETTTTPTTTTPSLTLDSEPFYFETDSLALRNNPDYSCLLKTLILLESQRIQACHDLERLIELKDQALNPTNSPSEFVRTQLPTLNLPERQKIYCLPQIEWQKYFEGGTAAGASGNNGGLDSEMMEAIRQQNLLNRNRSRRVIQQQQSNSSLKAAVIKF